ncbi:STAS domain-containing protein [Fulvivirgaceae bacterium BMA12]|uniref:Anti-sigma factor antagonist n=1 Tax=Agaribacillus aureus TaxID=3051825 RepID=A0ABT8LJ95_9BACT|nr:STAS domain-containing protein [Fulvivirgaceae bacterium BMA12]
MMQSKKVSDVTIVSFKDMDHLDARIAYRIKAELKGLISENENNIVMNLAGIDFIDSAGFGTIISGLKSSKKYGGDFKLCNASPTVMELMELMQLGNVFEVHNDENKCVQSFA